MAQTASPSDQTSNPTARPDLVPPDERFWERYSPHAEFSLSGAGSLAIHILIFGLLALMAWLGAILFSHGSRTLPVEAVRLDLGGGGGNRQGKGDGPNNGPAPEEIGATAQEGSENAAADDIEHPQKINVKPNPRLKPQFNEEAIRYLNQSNSEAAKTFQRLRNVTSNLRLSDGKPSGRGQGGTGSGGGSGDGRGTGVGNAEDPGHGNLTKREKRMIRWVMGFNPQDSQDYLAQLQGLGAILAVPIHNHAKPEDYNLEEYRVIRNLSGRPPKLFHEDIRQLNRIYWYDTDPRSAAAVMSILRLRLQPSHFIAFMPEELEQKLHNLETKYLQANHPGRTEDDITATKFRIGREHGKCEPEVSNLEVKKR